MPIAVAENGEDLREVLTNKTKLRELLKDPEALANYVEDSTQARIKRDPEIAEQLNVQAYAFAQDWLKDHATVDAPLMKRLNLDSPSARGPVRRNTLYNKNAAGAKHDGKFETLNDMMYAISEHSTKDAVLSKQLAELKNDLSSMKPSDGGFLIPENLRAELLTVALEKAIVRSRARVIPMDSLTVPFPTVDSTSNVSSIFGGVVGYWTEEGATLTESQPRFGRMELRAQKLTLYTEVPNELIADARPAMDAFLEGIFPEAIAWFEDVAFTLGGGVGEPLGYLNAPAAISATRSTTVAGTNVEWVDIVAMYSRMLPQSLSRAVWIISPDVMPSLLTMTLAGGTSPVFFGGGTSIPGSSQPPMSMLGIPIIVSEKARAVGTSGDINLVDFGFYLIGDRQAMSARQSEEYKFQNDLTCFRVIERVDGRPWLQSAITPQNGGATLSPFVKLTTSV
jgi:HK97 family phage major capsid protein